MSTTLAQKMAQDGLGYDYTDESSAAFASALVSAGSWVAVAMGRESGPYVGYYRSVSEAHDVIDRASRHRGIYHTFVVNSSILGGEVA